MQVEDHNTQDNGEGDKDHGKHEVLDNDGHRQGGLRHFVGQQQQEHSERQQGKDGEPHLLSCIWWEVEDKDGQERDEDAWGNDVDQVEERLPPNNEIEDNFLMMPFLPTSLIPWKLD